ncbi:hypothetical protein [Frondihabitans sp. PAMC 28766]|uniref:WXG100-like domain-containing protein n=1 Tax=Frondihabitans sp. PAMC 28766 TaxID=1795630 RepID=UPI000AE0FAA5|nr:hypothetical protein [Frondihabitans sp. PAMC 28766]
MAYSVLSLDPSGYADAAGTARQALSAIESAAHSALRSLSGLAHMAGNDEAGGKFAHVYDSHSKVAFNGLGDLCSALAITSSALDASAASHAAAEAANTAGSPGAGAGLTGPSTPQTVTLPPPASAYGGTNILPQGWTVIQSLVSATWPDADTDKMHRATSAWNELADDIDSARSRRIASVLDPLEGFRAPDIAAIDSKVTQLIAAAQALANACRDIAELCNDYAASVVEAHTEVLRELVQFGTTTAAAMSIGIVLTPVTAGLSDALAGGAAAAEAVATAAKISETLAALVSRSLAITSRVVELSERPLALGTTPAKLGIFAAKSIHSGTIWGTAASGSDWVANGGDAEIGRDFGMAYVGGAIGGAVEDVGELAAAGARRRIDLRSRGSRETLPVEAQPRAHQHVSDRETERGAATTGPRHANSPLALVAGHAIDAGAKGLGVTAGGIANQYVFEGGTIQPDKTVRDAVKDLLNPSVSPRHAPKHLLQSTPKPPFIGSAAE